MNGRQVLLCPFYDQGHFDKIGTIGSSTNPCTMTMIIIGLCGYLRMFLSKSSHVTAIYIAHDCRIVIVSGPALAHLVIAVTGRMG